MSLVRKALAAAVVSLTCVAAMLPAAAQQEPRADKKAVEEIVRDYLMRHPEVIVEALQEYKRQGEERERMAAEQVISDRAAEIFRDPSSPVGGNAAGDVVLVEFFDYRCGVCKSAHPAVAKLMETDPGIRRVYKEWPILGPQSIFAARAALASRAQGKYLAFHDALMEAKGNLTQEVVMGIARQVGIDTRRLQRDMDAPEIADAIRRNFALAEALRLNGTPSFLIGNTLLHGARDLDTMRALVARARKSG